MEQETKKCPMCAEEIPVSSVTCEYCGARFKVTFTGYCQHCHDMRDADENGLCQTCGSEVLDWQVESRFVEAVIQEPIPASQPKAREIQRPRKQQLAFEIKLPVHVEPGFLLFPVHDHSHMHPLSKAVSEGSA